MEVNLYGPWRVTRAFAPLIIANKGRITTIGSISGILAPRDLTAYAMSKHAIEAFADSMAAQMAPLGVLVSIVEPGNFDSDIGKSATKRTGKDNRRFTDRSKYKKPDEVAAAVEQALFEATPKRRYMVTPDQREAEITIRKQIEQLVQLNEGHPYTYDRDALIKMLDEVAGDRAAESEVAGSIYFAQQRASASRSSRSRGGLASTRSTCAGRSPSACSRCPQPVSRMTGASGAMDFTAFATWRPST